MPYSTICKWELRNKDRRVAKSIPNIFFKLKKLQIKRIQVTAQISLRKCKLGGRKYTVGDFKNDKFIQNLISVDEGYRVLRHLRGSPPYFEKCQKDLFAMIRQFGCPTWFASFSAAETKWLHLLKILGKIVENCSYSDEEVKAWSWQRKSELIQKDPVTCARNFEHMVQVFIYKFLKSAEKPIGEITDFFYRVEFQQRGSPHIHCLFWAKDAPIYGREPDNNVVSFVDRYVTCAEQIHYENSSEIIDYQKHKHSKTCRRKNKNLCRFNFPQPPMPETLILKPLELENLGDDRIHIHETYENISTLLNEMKFGSEICFSEFLEILEIS